MSLSAPLMTRRAMEEAALAMTIGNANVVMGIQIGRGKNADTVEGIELAKADTFLRLYPQNVFNKAFFKDQIAVMKKDKKVKLLEVDVAVMVELVKPWLFYDMPMPRKSGPMKDNLLPFTRDHQRV